MFGHDQATTYTLFYNASIIQDIKQKYIVIIYPFYDVLYEVNIHCFLLSIQITVVSALSMYSTKSWMREELSPLIIIIISIFKEDDIFSITASLPYGPPMNTDIDYYQIFFGLVYFCKCCEVSCAIFC